VRGKGELSRELSNWELFPFELERKCNVLRWA